MKSIVRSLALALTLLAAHQVQAQESAVRQLTVTGEGVSSAVPNLAIIRLGVQAEAETAAAALSDMAARLETVINGLVAAGVVRDDLTTSTLSLRERFDQNGSNPGSGGSGYVASSILSVRTQAMGQIGALLDAAVTGGANQIEGISFTVANTEAALTEARRIAVAQARAKAEVLAEAAGVTLGPLLTIREGGGSGGPMPGDFARMSVPVETGQLRLSATVVMVYAIE